TGRRNAPWILLPKSSGLPEIPQWVGTVAGRCGNATIEIANAATTRRKEISRLWSRILFRFPCLRLRPRRELLQHVLKHRCRQLVTHELAFLFRVDQARILKHAQVTRDGWPR